MLACLALPGSYAVRGEPPVPEEKQNSPAPSKPARLPGETPAAIDRLLKQLGSNDFRQREAASRALEAIGEPALEALRRAATKNADIEIRHRAEGVVEAMGPKLRGELRCFNGHTDYVTGVAFSPDGNWALSGSKDKTVRLLDMETGKELRCFDGHTDALGVCQVIYPL